MSESFIKPVDEENRNRIRSTEINSSLVIEAGAGTGKTSLLIDRITTLLKTFDITEIVGITFTDNAASELEDRLRRNLEEMIRKGNPHLAGRFLQHLNKIDRANLSTIHSFASSLIRERPVEIGIDPDFTHLEDDEALNRLQELLFQFVANAGAEYLRLIDLYMILGGRLEKLADIITSIYTERDLLRDETTLAPIPEPAARVETFACKLGQLSQLAFKEARAEDPGRKQVEALQSVLPAREDFNSSEAWSWLFEIAGIDTRAGSQGNWTSKDKCKGFKEEVKQLKEDVSTFIEDYKTLLLNNLLNWMTGIIRKYEVEKLAGGALGFQDLLLYARDLLMKQDSTDYYRDRFRRILIDEFQDTDPIQVDIALLLGGARIVEDRCDLSGVEIGKLCIVGDPKQSIYRFRRADPHIYIDAAEKIEDIGRKIRIVQNFRSDSSIIRFVNEFFRKIWNDISTNTIAYEALQPNSNRPGLKPSPSVLIVDTSEDEAEILKVGDARKTEAEAIVRIINTAIRESWQVTDRNEEGDFITRKAEYRDIAILCSTTTDLELYTDLLREADIPFHIEGGKGFYRQQVVIDILNCVTAIDNPADRLSFMGALRSPFFGVPDDELSDWLLGALSDEDYRKETSGSSEKILRALSILKELHDNRISRKPVETLDMLFRLTHAFNLYLSLPRGETEETVFKKMLDLARTHENENGTGLRGFRRWLQNRVETESDETLPAPPSASHNVRIVTIHRSKGLEYPIVILANLNAKRNHSSKSVRIIPDRFGKRLHVRVGNAKDGFRTEGFDQAEETEKLEDASERLRLLYVAMTRARDHLAIPLVTMGEKTGEYAKWIDLFVKGELAEKEEAELSFRFVKNSDLSRSQGSIEQNAEKDALVSRILSERNEWLVDRQKRLEQIKLAQTIIPSDASRGVELPGISNRASGQDDAASIGIALHQYLAICELSDVIDLKLLDQVTGQNGAITETVLRLVKNCLKSPIWKRAIAAQRTWRETPFVISRENDLVRGIIDMLWEDSDGAIYLVDWKSGHFMPDAHLGQLKEYSAAVDKATGRKPAQAYLYFAASNQTIPLNGGQE